MIVINGELHHRSVTGAFHRCVSPEEGQEIPREIHEGDCGHHAGSQTRVAEAFRHGSYWLTPHADAEDWVSKCDGCQRFSRRAHVPAQELRMIPITGLLRSGGWIWLDLSKGPRIRRPTFWWQLTSLPSGLKRSQLASVMQPRRFNI